jgi:hypothetical protein
MYSTGLLDTEVLNLHAAEYTEEILKSALPMQSSGSDRRTINNYSTDQVTSKYLFSPINPLRFFCERCRRCGSVSAA